MLIYKITNKINGKIYIGQTRRKLKCRINGHMSSVRNGSNLPIHNAIRKYGEENFNISVVCECKTIEDLCNTEIDLINKYSLYPMGYNVIADVCPRYYNKGRKFNDQHKNKIREKFINRLPELIKFNSKDWVAIDPLGNIFYFSNLEKFCRENDLERSVMTRVAQYYNGINNGYSHHKKWKCFYKEDYDLEKHNQYEENIYELISPDGEKFSFSHPCIFADEHNLDRSSVCKLIRGIYKNVKGWKISND